MLKKLVAGTLVAGFALTGGLGAVSAEEKSNTIKSFDYLKWMNKMLIPLQN